jgi:hypothetical protein
VAKKKLPFACPLYDVKCQQAMQARRTHRSLPPAHATNIGRLHCSSTIWRQILKLIQAELFGGQIWKKCKCLDFGINASGAIWRPNLELMQVAPSGDQILN